MKIRKFLYLFIACALVLTSCPSPIVSPGLSDEEELQKAAEQADEKSQDLLGHVSKALTEGDYSGLKQYLAEEDENGELAALLAQYGITVSGKAVARGFSLGEGPSAADLQDGDTLVFRGDGSTWHNQLMRLVYPGFYHHAGSFDAKLANLGVACVISATIDADENGLCFQTLEELNSTSIAAARLRYYNALPGEVAASVDGYIDRTNNDTTYFAFLHLNLDPVSRYDEDLWYCSKVPWRVYWDAYEDSAKVDIEGSSFYEDPDRFEEMKDSYVYQTYLWLLQRILPRRLRGLAEERAEAKLREVLSELVSPDELRSSARVIGLEHWGETEPEYFVRGDIAVTGVTVDPSSVILGIGKTQQLTAKVFPADATNQNVSWDSSDYGMATVNSSGLVSAVAPGFATITATTEDGGHSDTCFVTVSEVVVAVSGVVVTPSSITLKRGDEQQLTAVVLPLGATNQNVSWSSNNEGVATVDDNGLVTAVAAGAATITVTTEDGEFTATCTVTVVVPVTGVALALHSLTLVEGGATGLLTVTITPADATNKSVTWSSSDPSVAYAGPGGIVTAASPGTTVITVTTEDGGFTDTCEVEVVVPVDGVTLAPHSLTLVEGGATGLLTVTITPADATNKSVTWSSSDPSVAYAGPGGIVTAASPGTTVITVTTEDGGFTDICDVTVIEAKGWLNVYVEGSPAEYFDTLARERCRLIAVQHGYPPEVPANRVVDQTLPHSSLTGCMMFDSEWIDAGVYDVYCWFDVGPDEGVLDDGDHSVWQEEVSIYPGAHVFVNLFPRVLAGSITWDPDLGWPEIHLWVALVVPAVEVDPDTGDITDVDFIDLEDAGVLDEDTSYLGFTYRRPSDTGESSVVYALDITGLKEILDDVGNNPACFDEPYNPCYLFAFIEPELVPGEEGAASDGDIYGFYGYPDQVFPLFPPLGADSPNVDITGQGLVVSGFALTETLEP